VYEAGCNDATAFIGKVGYLGLNFVRAAQNAESAEPDLLNLSELAFLFDFSKQNMRKYARGEIASVTEEFPSPVIAGKASYWHVAEIAQWLKGQGVRKIADKEIEMLFTIWSASFGHVPTLNYLIALQLMNNLCFAHHQCLFVMHRVR